ncbi:MAG: hypothetical protein QGG54_03690 [Gammaproteobacteria bacterium]|nr:hypothetical protein [Gammaproteobacteria bacterium]HAJ76680.1 hypothetical protein [Gammaproteobacteria bacterium]
MLAGFEERRDAFREQGVAIIAATVDSEQELQDIAASVKFPVAWGVSISDGDAIGAWWEPRRDHIQPSEFLLSGSGKVMISSYSNAPIGRMNPAESLTLVKYLNEQRARTKQQSS